MDLARLFWVPSRLLAVTGAGLGKGLQRVSGSEFKGLKGLALFVCFGFLLSFLHELVDAVLASPVGSEQQQASRHTNIHKEMVPGVNHVGLTKIARRPPTPP